MDGAVRIRGVFDDSTGLALVGAALNNPIDIYSEVVDSVRHDLRDNVVLDVANLSLTDQTLRDVIADSARELAEEDTAGNKIRTTSWSRSSASSAR